MTNDLNALAWYDSLDKQNHRKWWTQGQVFNLIEGLDYIPPFQLTRGQTGAAITQLLLIDFNTGASTDILANASATGLEVHEFASFGYDLITYPSTIALQLDSPSAGHKYLQMSDGTNTWYSEVFNMCSDLSEFIKIEYWHPGRFDYPNGHIRYIAPYKSRLYVASDVARPSYQYEEDVVKQRGYNLPIQQISYKVYKFQMLAPEYLIDALRVVRMHDFCQITWKGYTYDIDEMLMGQATWQEGGHLAEIEVEFRTDTVVVMNARGLSDTAYEITDGTCLPVDFQALATLEEGGAEYLGGYWDDNGTNVDLEADEYIIKEETGGNLVIEQWNGSSFDPVASTNDQIAYDARTDTYYFYETDTYKIPYITSTTGGRVKGKSFANVIVDVYVTDGVSEVQTGSGLSSELEGAGIAYTNAPGHPSILIKVTSYACSLFGASAVVSLGDPVGIGTMVIESTFIVG